MHYEKIPALESGLIILVLLIVEVQIIDAALICVATR